ncbi:MAG: hypothetical protein ACLR1T_16300 [Evtepia gabavorous]
MELPILADVLEIREEAWRGAVEGYLNTQKFYLLVDPACYREALEIYNRMKRDFGNSSFGIVDVGKLRERERLEPRVTASLQKWRRKMIWPAVTSTICWGGWSAATV